MSYPEYCSATWYKRGQIVWYGELAYIVTTYENWNGQGCFVIGEAPDESTSWSVYWRTV